MGLSVVGVALGGLVVVYILSGMLMDGGEIVARVGMVNGYAMGASLVALFARSGGGIFTKGADMGADLVGKVEAGIPEDDPRNPGVIADNVGDNVGDVAGLGADLLESYVESIIASMAILSGYVLATADQAAVVTAENALTLMMLPIVIAAAGILCSIGGVLFVKYKASGNPQSALMNGTYIAAVGTIICTLGICGIFQLAGAYGEDGLAVNPDRAGWKLQWWGPFAATVVGILAGMFVGFVSEFYTSKRFKPVQSLARDGITGPAISVTSGMAVGMQSCALPVIGLVVAVSLAYYFADVYGIAMAAFGMLATTGMVVAVDSYGPIADNAGGIAEMAGLDPSVREITDNLDAVGNTTAAIGKGFAIGSAAFAAMGLLVAYLSAARIDPAEVSIASPRVLGGLLLGGMFPFLVSSWLFKAVSRAAYAMIAEVRRQFKEIPGLREGAPGAEPDSARCVEISTQGAINGMILPGLVTIVTPVVVGLLPFLGKEGLAGLLVGAITSGLMLGLYMANSGGAMDNAKKFIEEGLLKDDSGEPLGKGSDAHKAAVVGDTVGDPMKDTVGPSINILIKLMAVVSLVFASLF
jgi:K(+)-stimulated pyrophosphate-energized sodium pump